MTLTRHNASSLFYLRDLSHLERSRLAARLYAVYLDAGHRVSFGTFEANYFGDLSGRIATFCQDGQLVGFSWTTTDAIPDDSLLARPLVTRRGGGPQPQRRRHARWYSPYVH
jgi:hypothetical protein